MIDLTLRVSEGMLVYPGDPAPVTDPRAAVEAINQLAAFNRWAGFEV